VDTRNLRLIADPECKSDSLPCVLIGFDGSSGLVPLANAPSGRRTCAILGLSVVGSNRRSFLDCGIDRPGASSSEVRRPSCSYCRVLALFICSHSFGFWIKNAPPFCGSNVLDFASGSFALAHATRLTIHKNATDQSFLRFQLTFLARPCAKRR